MWIRASPCHGAAFVKIALRPSVSAVYRHGPTMMRRSIRPNVCVALSRLVRMSWLIRGERPELIVVIHDGNEGRIAARVGPPHLRANRNSANLLRSHRPRRPPAHADRGVGMRVRAGQLDNGNSPPCGYSTGRRLRVENA